MKTSMTGSMLIDNQEEMFRHAMKMEETECLRMCQKTCWGRNLLMIVTLNRVQRLYLMLTIDTMIH